MNAPCPAAENSPSILVVDTNATAAPRLAGKLAARGFPADHVTSYRAASTIAPARHYRTVVLIGDFRRISEVQSLISLRHKLPRTWIVAVSKGTPMDELATTLRYFSDALVTPPSTEELVCRLCAFSLRSRPL